MGRAEDRREDLLGDGTACAAVPAADLAHHDGRSNRVLCAPVGGVDGRIAEEREEGRCFDGQVGDEPLDGWNGGSRVGEQVQHLFEQAAAGNREPVRRHLAGRVAITQGERLLEALLDAGGERAAGMIALEQPTPAQQMRETRLMIGVQEATVRRPSIACEHAREILAEDRRGIAKPTAAPNGVDRGVGGGERPEPVQRPRDLPSRLVGADDRTAADLGTQRVVRRGGARRRTGTDMHQRPAGHADAEAISKQRDDVGERQAEAFVQDDDQGRRFGADLHGGCAERVRGLQRVPALHAPTAGRTRPDVHAELADDGSHHRQVFLILRDHVRAVHVATTRGARAGQGGGVSLIDPPGPRSCAVAPIRRPRASARRPAGALLVGLGKGRGLPKARAACRIELILELLVPALQPIALTLGARQRVAQPRNLLLLSLDQRIAIVRRRRAFLGHTCVMPEARNWYKYKILDVGCSRTETR